MSHSLNYLLSLTLRTYRIWSSFSPFAGTAEGSTINNVREDVELHNITVQEHDEINFQTGLCSPQIAATQAGLHQNVSVTTHFNYAVFIQIHFSLHNYFQRERYGSLDLAASCEVKTYIQVPRLTTVIIHHVFHF